MSHAWRMTCTTFLLAAASLGASAQDVNGRANSGRGGAGGTGSARPASTESARERRTALRDRASSLPAGDRRALVEKFRNREAGMAPEDREALGERSRGRGGNEGASASPEQASFREALRERRRALRAEVSAGSLNRHDAAEQLRAWLREHRPTPTSSP